MIVKDIMNPITDYVNPDETLQQAVVKMRAAKRLDRQGVKGIMVLDDNLDLVGILSIKDILRATIPEYLDLTIARLSWDGMLEQMASRVACTKVKDIMSRNVVTIREEASLMACADTLIKKNLQRMPVVNGNNKVVGIIYLRDLYNIISEIFIEQRECR